VGTCEVCWSRALAGTLIFSEEAPDILFALARNLQRLGALPEKLVWDRESTIAAGGRPTRAFAAFCGQLPVGWAILEPRDPQAKGQLERSHRFMRLELRAVARASLAFGQGAPVFGPFTLRTLFAPVRGHLHRPTGATARAARASACTQDVDSAAASANREYMTRGITSTVPASTGSVTAVIHRASSLARNSAA